MKEIQPTKMGSKLWKKLNRSTDFTSKQKADKPVASCKMSKKLHRRIFGV